MSPRRDHEEPSGTPVEQAKAAITGAIANYQAGMRVQLGLSDEQKAAVVEHLKVNPGEFAPYEDVVTALVKGEEVQGSPQTA